MKSVNTINGSNTVKSVTAHLFVFIEKEKIGVESAAVLKYVNMA